ncbi:MAG: beta-N-acetylglucosaminidase domain-containing protein [Deltaproteobacteria bacterium]|nr:beta-N-acetylglucosaminidase domain-containing protein [Deltaproteobacteria bacterium]MDZ4345683.1 beta-N-acetylglucosaminidase domain-containing protein [Candidatus Binatia bacterium]
MSAPVNTFARRGVVEGFFGPPWSMKHRKAIFAFGAACGMNTYLYAPKDDPYHRSRWRLPYPRREWRELLRLIGAARGHQIDFVYGFHPGEGLCFSANEPVRILFKKARRFYDAGVRTFAVLFDDIPSRLVHKIDRKRFKNSLAAAEGTWLKRIIESQPAGWTDVEWWICPSYYTQDPLLARMFGAFEPQFLETLGAYLPPQVACFWTGPSVVSKTITLAHVRGIANRVRHPLILWDNYPVNDLSMSDELHIGPLRGRDPRLPEAVYGYLNNPLLQEELGFVPLATCFDYAADPRRYRPEVSWTKIVKRRFGPGALAHWGAIRNFCERNQRAKKSKQSLRLTATELTHLKAASRYLSKHRREKWGTEIKNWRNLIQAVLR